MIHLQVLFLMTIQLLHPSRVFTSALRTTKAPSVAAFASSSSSSSKKREQHLVLVGGGHAHAQVIKALQARHDHIRVTLIDMQASASYSGMVPGAIAGLYTPQETQIALRPLAEFANIDFIQDRVVDIDLQRREIHLKERQDRPIHFDVVSLDIGSTSPQVDGLHYTIPTRPIDKLVERLGKIPNDESSSVNNHFVVVGGGVAGIELAMAVTTRFEGCDCTLLHSGTELLPDESSAARNKLSQVMCERRITVRGSSVVTRVTKDAVLLESGDAIPYSHCIWAAGASPHALAKQLQQVQGLDTTKEGWIRVSPTLQSTSHPFVFAAGDCASIELPSRGPLPKAGVYAVRAGPVLIENLTRFLDDKPLTTYTPQDDFLKLLVSGKGEAIGLRFGLAMRGKWVFQLKDHIDRQFMGLFDVKKLEKKAKGTYDTSQYDATADDFENLPTPDEAAELLQREDDNVDYMAAWRVLRAMAHDEEYREQVLLQSPRVHHVAHCRQHFYESSVAA